MNQYNQEHELKRESRESDHPDFVSKLKDLLPGVDFEETVEMFEARTAVLEALARPDQTPDFLRSVWAEYAKTCEQVVDSKTQSDAHPQIRAQFQVASLVHKALIFREIGNMQRYGEDLTDAEEYALTKHLDKVAEVIGKELDALV